MLLTLTLLLLFLFSPLTAWAYFDPGFGGYLVNSIISLIATVFAFLTAGLLYFFRTVIGQRLISLWQNHRRLCIIILLFVLGLGAILGGISVKSTFYNPSTAHPPLPGATLIAPQDMCKGYNLFNGKLIDVHGRTVKQWAPPGATLEVIDKNGDYYGEHDYYNKGIPFKNKTLLTQGVWSWGRYTWDNKPIWIKYFLIHHEIYLSPKGTIFTFAKEIHQYKNYTVGFDIILEFDKDGRQLQRYSLWDHLKEYQPYHPIFGIDFVPFPLRKIFLNWNQETLYDYFHLNSFFMLPPNALEEKDPAFRPGNWLISMRHGSMLFILDQDTKKIIWHAKANEIQGGLQGQHSASMLPDGNILLYDNGTDRKASRVLIIDPLTLKIKWQYQNKDFFSPYQGFTQALPNGNFLVTESSKKRIFELTPRKEVVWEYYDNDDKDGNIYRMIRYPQEMIDQLLQKGIP